MRPSALRTAWLVAVGLAAVVVGSLAFAAPCFADPWTRPTGTPTEADETEARDLYQRGVTSIEGGEPALGIQYLGLSYEKSGAYLPLYAIGVTLHSTKEYVRAYGTLRQLLNEHTDLPPDLRREATALYEDARSRVAVLVIEELPPRGEVTLDVGGRAVPDAGERPLHASVIPGRVTLTGERLDGETFHWSGDAALGKETRIVARWGGRFVAEPTTSTKPDAEPVTSSAANAENGANRDGGDSVLESPYLWISVGAAVVLGVIGVYALTGGFDSGLEPRGSNVLRL
jgi:hypothetical protein